MRMIRAVVAYDGTDLAGFQRQPNIPTVGGHLEAVGARLFGRPTPVVAAGRTDAGVHASAQVISLSIPASFPIDKLAVAWNSLLPRSISLRDVAVVHDEWSARYAALERRYVYLALTRRERCALRARFTGFFPARLALERMREASRHLLGRHDFRSFCGVLPEHGGTERTVFSVQIDRLNEDMLRFEIRGDGFLHRMVRVTVGTLIEVGMGKRQPGEMLAILAARDRRCAGHTAAAAGLYLAGVRYTEYDSYREPELSRAALILPASLTGS